jgi:hypothetical protein
MESELRWCETASDWTERYKAATRGNWKLASVNTGERLGWVQ